MIEIEIQNFQSIRKIKLKVDGFTGIEGRSNIGKSAIVRAIRCALTGAAGTDFVRHGTTCERKVKGHKKCKCHTTVRLESPQWGLTWEKGDSVNRYKFRKGEGPEEVYDSVSRGTPDFLLPDFESIKVGDSPELVQVVGQFNPIFLLNQSGPAVADVLSDVANLDNINFAMTLVNKDRKEAVSTRKVREKDTQSLLRALETYKDLDSMASRVARIRESYEALESKKSSVAEMDRFITRVQERVLGIKVLEGAVGPDLPDREPFENLSRTYALLDSLCSRAFDLMGALKKVSQVEQVDLPDSEGMRERSRELRSLVGFHSRVKSLEEGIGPLLKLESLELPDHPDNLNKALTGLLRLQTWEQRYPIKESAVQVLGEVDALELPGHPESLGSSVQKLRQLESWVSEVRRIKQDLQCGKAVEAPLPAIEGLGEKLRHLALLEQAVGLESSLGDLESSYADASDEVEEVLVAFGQLGICPTCSQPVEAGRCTGGHG